MVAIVVAVAGLAYWDARRESETALRDFAEEQSTLAEALAAALKIRFEGGGVINVQDLRAGMRLIERPGVLAIFVVQAGELSLRGTDGRQILSPLVTDALGRGESVVRIPPNAAAIFGLPPRTALAGLSHFAADATGTWNIIAVASAQRERDREDRARLRVVLSVVAAGGLVLVLGGVAMAVQRKEFALERQLALAGQQLKADEQLERASRAAAMGTLAIGVAHEISTPLGVIAARAEQMAPRVVGDERLSVSVAAILSQTERISQVIRGLLGLARGDAPAAQHINPRALVENAVALVEHRFAKAAVRVSQQVDADLPLVVGDPRLLEHAIINLLLNACDACEGQAQGQVAIQVHKNQADVEIVVADSGVGISPSDIGRALEPFFTTKARAGGTGLGLAIAREIVVSHRGSLVLASVTPRGTRAAIRLPPAEENAHG